MKLKIFTLTAARSNCGIGYQLGAALGNAETPECVSLRPETTDLIEIEGEHPQGNWHGMPQCGLGYHNVAQNGPT